jgi:Glycosyl hydrolase family 3 C-terminal domain
MCARCQTQADIHPDPSSCSPSRASACDAAARPCLASADVKGLGIVVVGETPYAEGKGDRTDLALAPEDAAAVENMRSAGIPVVVVLISGRPLIVNNALERADAFVAAWLSGHRGSGCG